MSLEQLVQRHQGASIALGLSLVAGVVSVGFAGRSALMGSKTNVSAAALESGANPESGFVEIEGRPLSGVKITEGTSTAGDTRIYVPLVSSVSSERPNVAVVVAVAKKDESSFRQQWVRARYSGTLSKNNLPGPVRERMKASVPLAADHWVLAFEETPQDGYSKAAFFFAVALVLGVSGLVAMRVRSSTLRANALGDTNRP